MPEWDSNPHGRVEHWPFEEPQSHQFRSLRQEPGEDNPSRGDNRRVAGDSRMETIERALLVRGPARGHRRRAARRQPAGRAPPRPGRPRRGRAHLRPPAGAADLGRSTARSAFAGSLAAVAEPAAGFALVLLAATSLYLDLNARFYLLRHALLPPRVAERRLARLEPGRARPAHARRPLRRRPGRPAVRAEAGRPAPAAHPPAALPPHPPHVLVDRDPAADARARAWPASTPTWSPSRSSSPPWSCWSRSSCSSTSSFRRSSPGANDNASGVAVALAARRIACASEPPEHLDVWVVLTGAEECGARGHARLRRAAPQGARPRLDLSCWRSTPSGPATSAGSRRRDSPCRSRWIGGCSSFARRSPKPTARPMTRTGPPRSGTGSRPTRSPRARAAGAPTAHHLPRARRDAAAPTTTLPADLPGGDRPRRRSTAPRASRWSWSARSTATSAAPDAQPIEPAAMNAAERGEKLWEPSPEAVEQLADDRLHALARGRARPRLRRRLPPALAMVGRRPRRLLALDLGLLRGRAPTRHDAVLGNRAMPGAEWFPGAELNYAEHLFRGRDDDAARHPARLRAARARTAHLGRARAAGRRVAAGLRELGVEPRRPGRRLPAEHPRGDRRVLRHAPRSGAIWSSCSPDFGARSVVDRFAQIEPKVLFCVDGYRYGGKDFDRLDVVAGLEREMPSLERTVVLPYLDPEPDPARLGQAARLGPSCSPPAPAPSSSSTPVDIRPPALGPLLLGHHRAAEGDRPGPRRDPPRAPQEAEPPRRRPRGRPRLLVHHDRLDDVELPRLGAAHARLDRPLRRQPGSPGHGRPLGPRRAGRHHLLRHLRQLHRRLHEGRRRALDAAATSRACAPSAPPARRSRPRASSGSTTTSAPTPGSSPPRAAPTSAPRSSAACPLLPVHRGELQGRALGCKVEAFAEDGTPLIDEVGELVITEPMPSMPVFFWNDPDGERYRASYFDMYPGVWRHGDWIEITSRGTAVIYGRSDSTINRGGIRMGTSEIYRAVLALDEITDALVVDVPRAGNRGLDAAVRRPARRRGAGRGPDQAGRRPDPHRLLAAPRPERAARRSRRSRAPSRARCSRSR